MKTNQGANQTPIGPNSATHQAQPFDTRISNRDCYWWKCLFASCVIWLGLAPLTRAATLFVNASQTNNPATGSSWGNAYAKVQQALNKATNGDSVWVARGAYPENLTLSNGVSLYGGFRGNETTLNQRDWITNLTILDGRQSNSVITVALYSTNPATRIDGFRIQNGRASLGGGIYCSYSTPTIVNNQIVWNTATNSGGSSRGAGIYFTDGSPVIASNLVQGNLTVGPFTTGGSICWLGGSPVILNNRIVANVVSDATIYGGLGITGVGTGTPKILGNLIAANRAVLGNGAGIRLQAVTGGEIINNTVTWNNGGGIYCDTNSVTVANNIIAFNSAGVDGTPGMIFRNNCTFGNQSDFIGFSDPTGQNGNISVDPLLVMNPYYPEFHLDTGSPCIDAGDSTQVNQLPLDLDGTTRIMGTAVDIGVDEFAGAPPVIVSPPICVSTTGNDTNNGLAWSSAKRTVQAAIDQANLGGAEIWVQAGIYTNNLLLRPFAYLYGGFTGTESNRIERNWQTNASILDGGKLGRVITIQPQGEWSTIDGFVIRQGLAASGAGIYLDNASIPVTHNTITNNHASGPGGGIYNRSSAPMITQNLINANSASNGGGIFWYAGTTPGVISKNRFVGNWAKVATSPGLFSAAGGGGLFVDSGYKNAIISENFFLGNSATNQMGGAICANSSYISIVNNTISGNRARTGGGLFLATPSGVIANNLIVSNNIGVSAYFAIDTNLQFNCVYGNATNYTISDQTGFNGNISVDPLLLAADDYHLSNNSPCINSGDSNFVASVTDLDGAARIVSGAVDMGAHEFPTPTSALSYAWLQRYGLTTDGSADFADPDGDNASNWLEWQFGTIPTNGMSAPAPVFLTQPQSFSQVSGISATFSAQLTGAPPVHLQWQFNGVDIPGATGTVLTIPAFTAVDVGAYTLVATNAFGTTLSATGTLAVGEIAAWGKSPPVPPDATNLLALAAGYDHSLWLRSDQTVRGWNMSGASYSPETEMVSSLSNAVAIVAGYNSSLVLAESGVVVGSGTTPPGNLDKTVSLRTEAITGNNHALALNSDGTLQAWGFNQVSVPAGLSNAVAIAVGKDHNVILRADGTVASWVSSSIGANINGQTNVPPGLSNVVGVAAGSTYSLALKSDGTVIAWGGATSVTNLPADLTNIIAITSGKDHCLALRSDGSVVAWGANESGQSDVPPGLTNVVAISAGSATSLALVQNHGPILQAPLLSPAFSNGVFRAQIQTESGRVYRLEYKDAANSPEWSPLPLVAGNGRVTPLLDATVTSSNRIYRVRRW